MNTVKVGDRLIAVRPSALTPMLFKRKTNTDLLGILSDKSVKDTDKLESLITLFYLMAMQATCQDVKLEFEKAEDEMAFYEFLDGLDSRALYSEEVLAQIVNVYVKSSKTTSIAKN